MICKVCKRRYAYHPQDKIDDNNIKVFLSDKEDFCSKECEDAYHTDIRYRMQSRIYERMIFLPSIMEVTK